MPRSIATLAREAIDVQNACNPLGLSKTFAAVLIELFNQLPEQFCGTTYLRFHPITQLWVSKLHDLCGLGCSDSECYRRAYDACELLAAGNLEAVGVDYYSHYLTRVC